MLPVGLLLAAISGPLTLGGGADVEQVVGAFAAEIPERPSGLEHLAVTPTNLGYSSPPSAPMTYTMMSVAKHVCPAFRAHRIPRSLSAPWRHSGHSGLTAQELYPWVVSNFADPRNPTGVSVPGAGTPMIVA